MTHTRLLSVALLFILSSYALAQTARHNNIQIVAAVSANRVELRWTAVSTSGPSSYRVYRGVKSGGPYKLVTASNGTSATDATVVAGKTYYYVIKVVVPETVDRGYEGPPSAEVSVKIPSN